MSASAVRISILERLQGLDRLLKHAVGRAGTAFEDGAADDPFRGVYVSDAEADRLASGEGAAFTPGEIVDDLLDSLNDWPELDALATQWPLSSFDRGVLLLALAPEVHLRYERLYGYLQDDVTKRRPTVDLALALFCPDLSQRIRQRTRFHSDAPLITSGALRVTAEPTQPNQPLLARSLHVDPPLVDALLADGGADERIAPIVDRIEPSRSGEWSAAAGVKRLAVRVTTARAEGNRVVVLLTGQDGGGKRDAVRDLGRITGLTFLAVAPRRHPRWRSAPVEAVVLAVREAVLLRASLYVEGLDEIAGEREQDAHDIAKVLGRFGGVLVVATSRAWPAGTWPDEAMAMPFPAPGVASRRAVWKRSAAAARLPLTEASLRTLATFDVSTDEIVAAVDGAAHRLNWESDPELGGPSPDDVTEELARAVRAQTGTELAALTRRVPPIYGWDDLIVAVDIKSQLTEICNRVIWRADVLEAGGFGAKLSTGKGVPVLFSGPAGTGKTMATEVVAAKLKRDLYRVDLSMVVSKYIGETEKNLERIFTAAERANGVLVIDEGESLFSKRSEVRDAHDRYANVEVSYLLQRMEQYEGLTILTTNLRSNIDEAFLRRLAFSVHFPFPEEAERERIWRGIWPEQTRVSSEIVPARLARLRMSGGNIKNVALAAAFLAAAESSPVLLAHLITAIRREYEKVGKMSSDRDIALALEAEAVA